MKPSDKLFYYFQPGLVNKSLENGKATASLHCVTRLFTLFQVTRPSDHFIF